MTTPLSAEDQIATTEARNLAIDAASVGLQVPGQAMPILDDVTMRVQEGEFVALVGPSGSGKTTFLNMVGGLQQFTQGHILVRGRAPERGRPDTAYALARDAMLPWRTAVRNVELALQVRGVPRRDRYERALEALTRVGLSDAADQYRSQLSQGMRQRVALARTLVTEPSLLILDEPFAALDAQTRILMQQLLLELLSQFSGAMIFVTHDISEAITLADRIVVFSKRPARVLKVYDVDLPRPRRAIELRANIHFTGLFEEIWEDIVQEMQQ